jgi:hypothetical protein
MRWRANFRINLARYEGLNALGALSTFLGDDGRWGGIGLGIRDSTIGCGRDRRQHLFEKFLFFQILFGRGRLLVPVIVIVVTGTAANFGRFAFDNRNNRMIGQAAALNAVVIDHITQT